MDNKKSKVKIIALCLCSLIILITFAIASIYSEKEKSTRHDLMTKYLNEYIKEEFPEAEFDNNTPCYKCSPYDEDCYQSGVVPNCYLYFYKSKPGLSSPDLKIIDENGKIKKDLYSGIVKKYRFEEESDDDWNFHTFGFRNYKRSTINITLDDFTEDNIQDVYDMAKELVATCDIDKNTYDCVSVYITSENDYNEYLNLTPNYREKNYFWRLRSGPAERVFTNPKIDDLKLYYGISTIVYDDQIQTTRSYYYN